MLFGRTPQRLVWIPGYYFLQLGVGVGFGVIAWESWGAAGAAAAVAAILVPGMFMTRWIGVSDARVTVRGVFSGGSVPRSTARLEVRRSGAPRGGLCFLELVDGSTGDRVHAWSTLGAWGAVRVLRLVGERLEVPVNEPAWDLPQTRRGAWIMGGVVALLIAILVAGLLYVNLRAATLHVVIEPAGEARLDGKLLPLVKEHKPPRRPGMVVEVQVEPGLHRIAFRGEGHSSWVQAPLEVKPHQPYRLYVSFEKSQALLLGPHNYRKELPVAPEEVP
jgi:hypothetical protein